MIVIKVWCLPANQSEEDLKRLYQEIMEDVEDVISGPEFCLQGKKSDKVCLFPADLMKYGLGDEIIVEIDGLPDLDSKNLRVRKRLTEYVGRSVGAFYPDAKVKCSIEGFDPSQVVWTSA